VDDGERGAKVRDARSDDSGSPDEVTDVQPFDFLDIQNFKGLTALHLAAERGSPEITEALLDRNADMSIRDSEGRLPLHYAALQGHIEVAELLIDAGGDVDAIDSKDRTPFLYACVSGHLDLAKCLVDIHGADPHVVTGTGNNALHAACRVGHFNLIRWLIVEKRVDLYWSNDEDVKPIDYVDDERVDEVIGWWDEAQSGVAGDGKEKHMDVRGVGVDLLSVKIPTSSPSRIENEKGNSSQEGEDEEGGEIGGGHEGRRNSRTHVTEADLEVEEEPEEYDDVDDVEEEEVGGGIISPME